MSTEDQNRAVVTIQKGVDVDLFVNQMIDNGYTLFDEKPGSRRNFDFIMTKAQAEELKADPRIIDVRYGSKKDNGGHLIKTVLDDSRVYSKTTTLDNTHYNWAHASCTSQTDRFQPSSPTGIVLAQSDVNFQYPYTLTGQGVDVVIQDSGVDPNHPEWLNQDGTSSRYQSINWPNAAGLSGTYTQPPLHERDIDGHGTHVAGTAAGRLYGWARQSNIYSIKILDDPGNTYGVSASFNLIRGWHNAKNNGRPTVVNMSWGYSGEYTNITGGNWRGTPWTDTVMQAQYGMIQGQQNGSGNWTFPIRFASVDADIQDCLDDGIILIAAAGNGSHKCDVVTGSDYDNYFTSSAFGNLYYHRGSTPMGHPGVISVGNVSYVYQDNKEPLFNSSEKGPRVDISAPGGYIMSAIPDGSNIAVGTGTVDYPLNNTYKSTKISGTSMASPQVAGVVACLMEARPNYTYEQVLEWLQDAGQTNRLYDSTTGTPSTDYQNYRALQGAANLYLQTPFVNPNPYSVS
jgi:subtilisin family serine protease